MHTGQILTQLQSSGKSTSLHEAAKAGDTVALQELLAKSTAGLNTRIEDFSPLEWAVSRNQEGAALMLLLAKADPNTKDLDGFSALHMAVQNDRLPLVMLLLEAKANPDSQTKDLVTPLHLVDDLAIAHALLESKARVALQDVTKKTPLTMAAENGHRHIFNIMMLSLISKVNSLSNEIISIDRLWQDLATVALSCDDSELNALQKISAKMVAAKQLLGKITTEMALHTPLPNEYAADMPPIAAFEEKLAQITERLIPFEAVLKLFNFINKPENKKLSALIHLENLLLNPASEINWEICKEKLGKNKVKTLRPHLNTIVDQMRLGGDFLKFMQEIFILYLHALSVLLDLPPVPNPSPTVSAPVESTPSMTPAGLATSEEKTPIPEIAASDLVWISTIESSVPHFNPLTLYYDQKTKIITCYIPPQCDANNLPPTLHDHAGFGTNYQVGGQWPEAAFHYRVVIAAYDFCAANSLLDPGVLQTDYSTALNNLAVMLHLKQAIAQTPQEQPLDMLLKAEKIDPVRSIYRNNYLFMTSEATPNAKVMRRFRKNKSIRELYGTSGQKYSVPIERSRKSAAKKTEADQSKQKSLAPKT